MLSIINFLTFLIHFLLFVTIASYAVTEFHAVTSQAGLVAGIFIIGALFGRLGTGSIIEDLGNRKVLIAGAVVFIVTSALYYAAVNLTLLIIFRLLHGMAFGIMTTAVGTIIAKVIPAHRRGEGIGYYSMGAILAVALGPFIGIILIQYMSFKMIFIFTTILAIISFAISFFIDEPAMESSAHKQEKVMKRMRLANFLEFKAIPISIIILIIGFSYSGLLTFISLYAEQIHLEKAASFYFLIYSITVLISRPVSGRLLDVRGENFVIYPTLFLYALGMLLFSQANQDITLLLAGVIIGLSYGNLISCAQAVSIKGVPSHRLGLATSTYFIFVDLGFGIGPYMLGFLISYTGYRGLYLMMVFVILASIIIYYFLHGRKVSAKQLPRMFSGPE